MDNINILFWLENVFWNNFEYMIFRENDSGSYDFLIIVIEFFYWDEGFINGIEYCYYVCLAGIYGIEGILGLLLNNF